MRFSATGDTLITRRITTERDHRGDPLLCVIREADAGFTNLETSLTNGRGYPAAGRAGTHPSSPAACLTDLVDMGFNLFSRANNHAGNWGAEGVLETSRVCDEAGVCHAGVGRHLAEARLPAYRDLPAGKVALLSAATSAQGAGYRAGLERSDCRGRHGASCLRFEEYAIVPHDGLQNLRVLVEPTRFDRVKQYEMALGFRSPNAEGVFSVGTVRSSEGPALGEHWEPNQSDVEEILCHVRDARRQADFVLFAFHGHEMPAGDPDYERLSIDPITSTPADGFDRRNSRGKGGFAGDPAYWESVVACWEMDQDGLHDVRLYPVDLGWGRPRSQRDRPAIAQGPTAQRIIARMDDLCRPPKAPSSCGTREDTGASDGRSADGQAPDRPRVAVRHL